MINVKYFGSSDIPAFDENFDSIDAIMKKEPFKPFGQPNQLGPTGKGIELEKSNHNMLRRLDWGESGHKGNPSMIAGFDQVGKAGYFDPASLGGGDVGAEMLGVSINEDTQVLSVAGRKAILHSPSAGWLGAEWDMSAGKTLDFSAWSGAVTIYLTFDPDDEATVDITTEPGSHISIRLYTVTVTDGVAAVTRVWNSGDIDIIAMWLQGPAV